MRKKYGPEWLRIRTLFTQCFVLRLIKYTGNRTLTKQINSQTYGNSLESVQFQKYNYQWNLKTTDQYPFYQYIFYQDLRKSCFRANYQLYWKKTNISPSSIWLSQESFNCNTACQTTRWHQRSNESQRDNIGSLYRLLESIWYYWLFCFDLEDVHTQLF